MLLFGSVVGLLSLIEDGLLISRDYGCFYWVLVPLAAAAEALGVIIPPSVTNFIGIFEELSGILRIWFDLYGFIFLRIWPPETEDEPTPPLIDDRLF